MDGSPRVSPFLSGNGAPVRDELDAPCVVRGEMPRELFGAYYRNGANPQFDPVDEYHPFAGDGMVHGFYVEDGQVRYRNRYVRTPKWLLENEAGRALFGTFGNPATTDPAALGKDGGVANTNVVWHGGKLLALEEGHMPIEMDPLTLETRGYVTPYRESVTAHPKLDPETGEMVWFSYFVGPMPFARTMAYGVTSPTGEVLRRDDFEAPYCAMAHDFLVTREHVLFPVMPLTGSLERAMSGLPPFAWEPDKSVYLGVMARNAGVETIRWFETGACYVFHPLNAYEEGSLIHSDVMEYPAAPLFPNADGSPGANVPARLVRWTIDLAGTSNQIKRTPLDDMAGEFPRLDDRRAGLPYRHGWFAASHERPGRSMFDAIAHVDLKAGKRSVYDFGAADVPGEPVFVPRSSDAAEGDGWLVTTVYRGEEHASDFVVFEAQDVAAGPIACARAPRRVPFGFHGNWRQG
jgi:carotenoid cleavage dioxygenase-like enzyme